MFPSKCLRVKAALAREEVDRPPYAFWTHFPGIDLDPYALAKATVSFARELDLDFVKTMPNGLFCVEDWGVVGDYTRIAEGGVARPVALGVNSVADWDHIRRLDVTQGAYGRELLHLSQVISALGPEVPVLVTAFSPVTIACKLAGAAYRAHLKTHSALVLAALAEIAATTCDFVSRAIELGGAGIFFAAQEAKRDALSEPEYRDFALCFDHQVLAAASKGWFNVLHIHGENIWFDLLKDYPVTALNWHIGETAPTISDYYAGGGRKPIVGGLQRGTLTRGELDAVRGQIATVMKETNGRGILLSQGCVIRHPVDRAVLRAVAHDIKSLADV